MLLTVAKEKNDEPKEDAGGHLIMGKQVLLTTNR